MTDFWPAAKVVGKTEEVNRAASRTVKLWFSLRSESCGILLKRVKSFRMIRKPSRPYGIFSEATILRVLSAKTRGRRQRAGQTLVAMVPEQQQSRHRQRH